MLSHFSIEQEGCLKPDFFPCTMHHAAQGSAAFPLRVSQAWSWDTAVVLWLPQAAGQPPAALLPIEAQHCFLSAVCLPALCPTPSSPFHGVSRGRGLRQPLQAGSRYRSREPALLWGVSGNDLLLHSPSGDDLVREKAHEDQRFGHCTVIFSLSFVKLHIRSSMRFSF